MGANVKSGKNLRSVSQKSEEIIGSLRKYVDLYYDKLKYSIFPIPRGKKIPKLYWRSLQKKRMNKDDLLSKLSSPKNLGIVCGEISGLAVVDVDGYEGWKSLEEFGITYDTLKEYPHVATGRENGYHFYFKYPEDGHIYSSRAGVLPGVDIRAEKGYVLAPPSLHSTGNIYTWVVNPRDTPVSEMPSNLFSLIMKPQTTSRAEVTAESSNISRVLAFKDKDKFKSEVADIMREFWVKGSRHSLSLYLSGFLMKNGIDKPTVIDVITYICNVTGDSDLSDRLKSVDTTFELAPENIRGITGLVDYMEPDAIERLSRLFRISAYFTVNNVGFDKKGIYYNDTKGMPIYITKGEYQLLYAKRTYTLTGEELSYVIQINGKNINISLRDMLKPKERIYSVLTSNNIEISQTNCNKIADLINASVSHFEYPLYHSYVPMGWAESHLVVPNISKKEGILEDDSPFIGWNEVSGDISGLQKIYSPKFTKTHPALMAALGHVVISMFLPLLKQRDNKTRNIAMHLVGVSNTGKSLVALAAMSFFGNPFLIKKIWYTSPTGFELSLAMNNCMPIYFDESTILEESNVKVGQWLYGFEQGYGKTRGGLDGRGDIGLRKTLNWCLNLLSTGENSLLPGSGKGAAARVIELYFQKDKYLKQMEYISTNCLGLDGANPVPSYGWGLRNIVEYLNKYGRTGKDLLVDTAYESFKYFYLKILNLNRTTSRTDPRVYVNWALIAAGYEIACKTLQIKYTREDIFEILIEAWSLSYYSDEAINNASNLYDALTAHFYQNRVLYADSRQEFFESFSKVETTGVKGGLIGYIEKEDGSDVVYILRGSLKEILKNIDSKNSGIMRRQLLDSGLLISSPSGDTVLKRSYGGKSARFIAFKMEKE